MARLEYKKKKVKKNIADERQNGIVNDVHE